MTVPAASRRSCRRRSGSTQLDVQLATIGPLAMANSVARVEFQPDLQLTGTLAKPALSGQVAVAEEGGSPFERAAVPRCATAASSSVPNGHDAAADCHRRYPGGRLHGFLRLSGPANAIETSLNSDPPLGERDLQTLLVTGQRETLSGRSESDQAAVGAASGDVLGFAGQFLGFDSVVVGTTDDLALVSSDVDPALRLTVSKRLGNRFELVLSGQPRRQRADVGDHLSAAARIRVSRHLARRQRVHGGVPPGDPVRTGSVAAAHRAPAQGRTRSDRQSSR